jgi:hypothetical protein
MFLADHGDMLPDLTDMNTAKTALAQYVTDDSVFLDPRTGQPYAVNSTLSNRGVIEFNRVVRIAVFYEDPARGDGSRVVAFLGGNTASVSKSEWQEVKASSGIE